MAVYIYKTASGDLMSWCPKDTDPVADDATLTKGGPTKVSGLPALDDAHAWDAAQKTVVSKDAPVELPIPEVSGILVVNGISYKVSLV